MPKVSQLIIPLHALKNQFSNLIQTVRLRAQSKLVESSQLFDAEWYLAQYPDVAKSGVDPLMHFLCSGAQEGRNPTALFNVEWYLEQYPDVIKSGINPLVHYLTKGVKQSYDPNPLFDTDWYLKQYPEVGSEINPLTHYLLFGAVADCDPSPRFSTSDYFRQYPDVAKAKVNPLAHYFGRGASWLKMLLPATSNDVLKIPVRSALSSPSQGKIKLLFVGHDASSTGAPVLLLNIIRALKESSDIEASVILLTGGPLEASYRELASTYIVDNDYRDDKDYKRFRRLVLSLWTCGYNWALCNTVVTGKCTEILYRAGFIVVSAIHEMQSVIGALKVEEECDIIACYAHKVIFPANRVRTDFEQITVPLGKKAVINPQGLLKLPSTVPSAKETICSLLNIPSTSTLIVAAGLGDLRKGFDLYLQLARQLGTQDPRFHFIWIGDIAHTMAPWFKHDIETAVLRRCFHHVPFTNELSLYYQSANVFVLPSREDPFPSVVIEALAHGVPVVGFDNCGGHVDLLASQQYGELVSYGDIQAMAEAIQRVAGDPTMHTLEAKTKRAADVISQFDFQHYVTNILELFDNKVEHAEKSSLSLSTRP